MSNIWFSSLNSEEKDTDETPFIPLEKIHGPLFGKPKEIGFFSIDSKRNVIFDNSQMKYLICPSSTSHLNLDLNVNYSLDMQHNYITIDKMYQTLKWLLHHREKSANIFDNLLAKPNIDFITIRGTLVMIACTPYIKGHYRSQWEICASKFKGVIYFCRIDSDVDIEENENVTPRLALCQSWGYKFEQYMTSDIIDGECNVESNTFQMEEFCIILQNKLNKFSLLYEAEIDAVVPFRSPKPGSGATTCYTELKTTKNICGEGQSYQFHRYKLLTWWAQSYFTGIPEIVCGFRDDKGIVKELEIFRVSNLPKKAWGLWSPDVCLNFLEKFLNFLKNIVIEDDASIVYKFHYKGEDTIYCSKITQPSSRYTVLPDWYVKQMTKKL